MKKLTFATALLGLAVTLSACATGRFAVSESGYYGNINNGTGNVIECSQVIGGYCANNPMPANGYIQMLPDPGSHEIDGHIMVFDKTKPGAYVDNILFKYAQNKAHQWQFTMKSLYKKTRITIIDAHTVLLTKS